MLGACGVVYVLACLWSVCRRVVLLISMCLSRWLLMAQMKVTVNRLNSVSMLSANSVNGFTRC